MILVSILGFDLVDLLIAIGIGALAGWLASFIMNTKGGLLKNIIVGVIGGFVGRLVLQFLGKTIGVHVDNGNPLGTILVSVIGACLFIWLVKKLVK